MEYTLQDSGNHKMYESGALRDTSLGKGRFDLNSTRMLRRLAHVMEKGAAKYAARNWEKGLPVSRFLDSALRHINSYLEGRFDEDHLAQAVFNLAGAIDHTERIEEGKLSTDLLEDLPEACRGHHLEARDRTTQTGPLRIYVAGPFSAPTHEGRLANMRKACEVGARLAKLGHDVHVPHATTAPLDGVLPYERFMRLDLGIIQRWATALFYMGSSPGADRELSYAKSLGIPVYENLVDVPVYAMVQGPGVRDTGSVG